MILSANQPYFSPFPGFFYKMACSDVMVILDEVQFPRGTTWINRNRFKNDQGALWFTIPVWKKGLGLQKISEVKICHDGRWPRKCLESLKTAYDKAPFFEGHMDFIEEIFTTKFDKLIELNMKIIRYIAQFLGIQTRIVLLSELGIFSKGLPLLIDICKNIEATHFLSQRSAQKYFDIDVFQNEAIQLEFLKIPSWVYPQLWGSFLPNLSVFDLIFNCGPKSRDVIVRSS